MSFNPEQRIVVIGMGGITPFGNLEQTFDGVFAGEHAMTRIPDGIFPEKSRINAQVWADIDIPDIQEDEYFGEVMAGKLSKKVLARSHPVAVASLIACKDALRDSGILLELDQLQNDRGDSPGYNATLINQDIIDPTRIALCPGTGFGGGNEVADAQAMLDNRGQMRPSTVLRLLNERAATEPAMCFGMKGEAYIVTAACASSNRSVITGIRTIKDGDADIVLTGGVEVQNNILNIGMFDAPTALSTEDDPDKASRPFNKPESRAQMGFVAGNGAVIIALASLKFAEANGLEPLAEITGYGSTNDAGDPTMLDGKGATRAIEIAMKRAGIYKDDPENKIYVNAHATGTGGDGVELNAIRQALGTEGLMGVSSTKGATGHLLGAAGAVELAISIRALNSNTMPPTIKNDNPIPEANGVNIIPNKAQRIDEINTAISNSFGFGGINDTIVLQKV